MIFQPAYVGRAWAEYASRIRDIVVAVDQAADIASLLKERGAAAGRVGVVGLGDVMKVDDLRTWSGWSRRPISWTPRRSWTR